MVVKTNTLGGEAAGKSHAQSEVSGQILAFAFVAWRLRKVLSWPIFRYGVCPFSCGPCIRKSWAEGLSELLETDRFQDSHSSTLLFGRTRVVGLVAGDR